MSEGTRELVNVAVHFVMACAVIAGLTHLSGGHFLKGFGHAAAFVAVAVLAVIGTTALFDWLGQKRGADWAARGALIGIAVVTPSILFPLSRLIA
jgi:hypothetical protein